MFNLQSAFCNIAPPSLTWGNFQSSMLNFNFIKIDLRCKIRYFFVTLHTKTRKSVVRTLFCDLEDNKQLNFIQKVN